MKYVTYLVKYNGIFLPPYYIGSTSEEKILSGNYFGSIVSKRWKYIFDLENKYNRHLFSVEILTFHDTRKEALKKELEIQVKNNVVKSCDYFNESFARPNGFFGRTVSGINHPMYGKHHSNKTKELLSKIQTGKSYVDKVGETKAQEWIEKIRKSNTGKIRTQEMKDGVSGINNAFYGKTHTIEAKAKISAAGKGRIPPNKDSRVYLKYDLSGQFIEELKGSEIPLKWKGNVSNCAKGKRKSTHGFMWLYKTSDKIQLNIDPVKRLGNSSKISVPVHQYDMNNIFIQEWPSIAMAQKELGIKTSICSCCKGNINQAGGFIWKYKDKLS